MLDITLTKLLSSLCFLLVTILFTILPRWISSCSEHVKDVSNCFGGGVLLGVSFLHLLPEVQDTLGDALKLAEGANSDYPLGMFIVMVGLFLVLIADTLSRTLRPGTQLPLNSVGDIQTESSYQSQVQVSTYPAHSGQKSGSNSGSYRRRSLMRSVILTVALTFHSVLEGLAIGVQSNPAGFWSLFSVVLLHKGLVAFSYGSVLFEANLSVVTHAKHAIIFSLSSPFGVLIGALLAHLQLLDVDGVVSGVLTALATGTFLYVTFLEILSKQLEKPDAGWSSLLSCLTGFALFAVLSMFRSKMVDADLESKGLHHFTTSH